ncbi:MAG: hypothetical protein JKY19_01930 [Alcanivoracaceae bacterium]|nr:hypothetical protein [Alcanivoracaceae bacterium]
MKKIIIIALFMVFTTTSVASENYVLSKANNVQSSLLKKVENYIPITMAGPGCIELCFIDFFNCSGYGCEAIVIECINNCGPLI